MDPYSTSEFSRLEDFGKSEPEDYEAYTRLRKMGYDIIPPLKSYLEYTEQGIFDQHTPFHEHIKGEIGLDDDTVQSTPGAARLLNRMGWIFKDSLDKALEEGRRNR